MVTAQPTCEDRIANKLQSRLESVGGLITRANSGNDEAALEEILELPIGRSVSTVVKIELSWGGPADWFEVWLDELRNIDRIIYHFLDWFDHAERELQGSEFEAAESFCRYFTETF